MSENNSHFLKRSRSTRSHPESTASAGVASSSKTAALLGVSSRQRRSTTTNTSSARKNQTRNRDENSTEFIETDGLVSLPASRPGSPTEQLATNLSSLSVDDLRRALSDLTTEPRLLKCGRAAPASTGGERAVVDDKSNAGAEQHSRPIKLTCVTLASTLQCVPIVEQNETGSNNGTPPHSTVSHVEKVALPDDSTETSSIIHGNGDGHKADFVVTNEDVKDGGTSRDLADLLKESPVCSTSVSEHGATPAPVNVYKRKSTSEKLRTRSANYDCDDAASEGSKTPRGGVSPTTNMNEAKEMLHRMVSYQHEKIKREEKVFDNVEYAAKSKSLPRDSAQRHRPHSSSLPSCNVPLPPPMHSISWNNTKPIDLKADAADVAKSADKGLVLKSVPLRNTSCIGNEQDVTDSSEKPKEYSRIPCSSDGVVNSIHATFLSSLPSADNRSSGSSTTSERSSITNSENAVGKFSVTMTGTNRCASSVAKQDLRFKLEAFPDKMKPKSRIGSSNNSLLSSADSAVRSNANARALQQFKNNHTSLSSSSTTEVRCFDSKVQPDDTTSNTPMDKFFCDIAASADMLESADSDNKQPISSDLGDDYDGSMFSETMRSLVGIRCDRASSPSGSPQSMFDYQRLLDDELEVPQIHEQRRRLKEREIVRDSLDEENDDDDEQTEFRRGSSKLDSVRRLTGDKALRSSSGQLNDNNSTSSESSKATNSSAEASSKYNNATLNTTKTMSPSAGRRSAQQRGSPTEETDSGAVEVIPQQSSSPNNDSSRNFCCMDEYITPSQLQRRDSSPDVGDSNNFMPRTIVASFIDADHDDRCTHFENETFTSTYPPPRNAVFEIDDSNVVESDVREQYNHSPVLNGDGGGTYIKFGHSSSLRQPQCDGTADNISPQRMQGAGSSSSRQQQLATMQSSVRQFSSSDDAGNSGSGSTFHHHYSPTGSLSYHPHYHPPPPKGISINQIISHPVEREKQQRQDEDGDRDNVENRLRRRRLLREKLLKETKSAEAFAREKGGIYRGEMDVDDITKYINNDDRRDSTPMTAADTSGSSISNKNGSPQENKQRHKQSRRVSADSNAAAGNSHEVTHDAAEPRSSGSHNETALKSSPEQRSPLQAKLDGNCYTEAFSQNVTLPIAAVSDSAAINAASDVVSSGMRNHGSNEQKQRQKQRRTKRKNRKAVAKTTPEIHTINTFVEHKVDDECRACLSPSHKQNIVNDIVVRGTSPLQRGGPAVLVLWFDNPFDNARINDNREQFIEAKNDEQQRQQNFDSSNNSTIKRQPPTKNRRTLAGKIDASSPADGFVPGGNARNLSDKPANVVVRQDDECAETNNSKDEVERELSVSNPAKDSAEEKRINNDSIRSSVSSPVVACGIPFARGKANVRKTNSTGNHGKLTSLNRNKPIADVEQSNCLEFHDEPATASESSGNKPQETRGRGASVSESSLRTPAVDAAAEGTKTKQRIFSGSKHSSTRFNRSASDKSHFSSAAGTASNSSPPGPGPATPAVSGSSGDGYVTAQTDSRSESVFESTSVEPDAATNEADAARNRTSSDRDKDRLVTKAAVNVVDLQRSQKKLSRASAGASGSSSNNDVVFDDAATTTRNTTSLSLRDDNESLTTGADEFDDRISTAASEPLHAVADNGWTKVEGSSRRRRSHNFHPVTEQNPQLSYHAPFLRTHQYYHVNHRNSGSSVGAHSSSAGGGVGTSGSNVYSASDDGRDGMPSSSSSSALHQQRHSLSSYRTASGRVKSRSLERRHGEHLNNNHRDAIIEDLDDERDGSNTHLNRDNETTGSRMTADQHQAFNSTAKFRNPQRPRNSSSQQWRSNNETNNIYDRDGYTDEDYADINARKQQQMGAMMPKSAEHEDINQNTAKQRLIAHDPSKAPPRSSTLIDNGKNTRVGSGGLLMTAQTHNISGRGRRSDPQSSVFQVNMVDFDSAENNRCHPAQRKKQHNRLIQPAAPEDAPRSEILFEKQQQLPQEPKRSTPPLPFGDVGCSRPENARKHSLHALPNASCEKEPSFAEPPSGSVSDAANSVINDSQTNGAKDVQSGTLKRSVQPTVTQHTAQQRVGSKEFPEYNQPQSNRTRASNNEASFAGAPRFNRSAGNHGTARAVSGQQPVNHNGRSRFSPVPSSSNHKGGGDSTGQTITFQQYRMHNSNTTSGSNARRSLPPGTGAGSSEKNVSVSNGGGRHGAFSYNNQQQRGSTRDFYDRKQSGSSGGSLKGTFKRDTGGSHSKPALIKSKSKEFPPLGAPPSLARGNDADVVPVNATAEAVVAADLPTAVVVSSAKPASATLAAPKPPPKSVWKSLDDSSLLPKRIVGVNHGKSDTIGSASHDHNVKKTTNDDMLYAPPVQQPQSPRNAGGDKSSGMFPSTFTNDMLHASGDAGANMVNAATCLNDHSALEGAATVNAKQPVIMPPRKSSMHDEILQMPDRIKPDGQTLAEPVAVRPAQTRRSATTDNIASSPGSIDFPPLPVPEGIRAKIRGKKQQVEQKQPHGDIVDGNAVADQMASYHSDTTSTFIVPSPVETAEIAQPPCTQKTSDVATQMTPTSSECLLDELQEPVRADAGDSTGAGNGQSTTATVVPSVAAEKMPSFTGSTSTSTFNRQQQFQHLMGSRTAAVPNMPSTVTNIRPSVWMLPSGDKLASATAPTTVSQLGTQNDTSRRRFSSTAKEAVSLRTSPTLPSIPLSAPSYSMKNVANISNGSSRIAAYADDSPMNAVTEKQQQQHSQPNATHMHRSNSDQNALPLKETVPVAHMLKTDIWSHVRGHNNRQFPPIAVQQPPALPHPEQTTRSPSLPLSTASKADLGREPVAVRASPSSKVDSAEKNPTVVDADQETQRLAKNVSPRSQPIEVLSSTASSDTFSVPASADNITNDDEYSGHKTTGENSPETVSASFSVASNQKAENSSREAVKSPHTNAPTAFRPLTRQRSQPNLAAIATESAQVYANHVHPTGRQPHPGFLYRPALDFQQPQQVYPPVRPQQLMLPGHFNGFPLVRVRNDGMPLTQFLPAPPPSATHDGPLPTIGFPPFPVAALFPAPLQQAPRFVQFNRVGNVKIHPDLAQQHVNWQAQQAYAGNNQMRPPVFLQQPHSPLLNPQIAQYMQQNYSPYTVQNFEAMRGNLFPMTRPTAMLANNNAVPLMPNVPPQHQHIRFVPPPQQQQQPPVYVDLASHLSGMLAAQFNPNSQILPPHLSNVMIDSRTGNIIPVTGGGVHFPHPNSGAYENGAPHRNLHEGHIYKRPPYPSCVFETDSQPTPQQNVSHQKRTYQHQPTGLSYNMQTERLYGDMHNLTRALLVPNNGRPARNLQQQQPHVPQQVRKFQERTDKNTSVAGCDRSVVRDSASEFEQNNSKRSTASSEHYKQAVHSYRKIVRHFETQCDEQQKHQQQQTIKKPITVLSRNTDNDAKILRTNVEQSGTLTTSKVVNGSDGSEETKGDTVVAPPSSK